jgi:hypothetical protein
MDTLRYLIDTPEYRNEANEHHHKPESISKKAPERNRNIRLPLSLFTAANQKSLL